MKLHFEPNARHVCACKSKHRSPVSANDVYQLANKHLTNLRAEYEKEFSVEPLNLHAIDDHEFGARIHGVLFPSSPIQTHEFLFGRDEQMERIRRALMAPGRQVFIYGERGVGKSSLATAAATELQSSDANPLHASCGKRSTFSSVVWSLIRDTVDHP